MQRNSEVGEFHFSGPTSPPPRAFIQPQTPALPSAAQSFPCSIFCNAANCSRGSLRSLLPSLLRKTIQCRVIRFYAAIPKRSRDASVDTCSATSPPPPCPAPPQQAQRSAPRPVRMTRGAAVHGAVRPAHRIRIMRRLRRPRGKPRH